MTTFNKSNLSTNLIPGFSDFTQNLNRLLNLIYGQCSRRFNLSTRILTVGNGGNLAVGDQGAIDIARLTNKSASAPRVAF